MASPWLGLTPKWIRDNCGSGLGSMTSHKKRTLAGSNHQNNFERLSNDSKKKLPIYRRRPSKMTLSAVSREGPETVLSRIVMVARWQQDNIGVRFRSMTSCKNRFWQEARCRTALKGSRSPWKSNVVKSCHW